MSQTFVDTSSSPRLLRSASADGRIRLNVRRAALLPAPSSRSFAREFNQLQTIPTARGSASDDWRTLPTPVVAVSDQADPHRALPRVSANRGGPADAHRYDLLIKESAAKYGVDADLVKAVIRAESNFDTGAVSYVGARGLMQLMPATAAGLGVTDAFNPADNIDGGARYLSEQMKRFGGVELALAAYNAGPGAVAEYGGIPPYEETQNYVDRVMSYLRDYQAEGEST